MVVGSTTRKLMKWLQFFIIVLIDIVLFTVFKNINGCVFPAFKVQYIGFIPAILGFILINVLFSKEYLRVTRSKSREYWNEGIIVMTLLTYVFLGIIGFLWATTGI